MGAFARFQNDFNAMSDNDIIEENRRMEDQLAEAEDWLEAVAAWEAAGRPRATTAPEPALGGDEGSQSRSAPMISTAEQEGRA